MDTLFAHPVQEPMLIEERGVVVVEVGSLPKGDDDTFRSDNVVIGICMSGSAEFLYDMQPKVFEARDIGITLPNHVLSNCVTSPDYKAMLIIISNRIHCTLIQRESFVDYNKYHVRPAFSLSEEQFERVIEVVKVIKSTSSISHPKRIEMLENLLDILFYALTHFRGDVESQTLSSRGEQIFSRFYDLLLANYNTRHDVIWYADKLYLTPKYMSSLIFKTTGKSANEWINDVLILEAKKLLRHNRRMTVQQVAYQLGFSENSSFCRFFKRETGITPKEFRMGQNEVI